MNTWDQTAERSTAMARVCVDRAVLSVYPYYSSIALHFKIHFNFMYLQVANSKMTISHGVLLITEIADKGIHREADRKDQTDKMYGIYTHTDCLCVSYHHFQSRVMVFKATSTRSPFFSERVINAWNSLPTELDFASLKRFRRAIENVAFSAFTKRF